MHDVAVHDEPDLEIGTVSTVARILERAESTVRLWTSNGTLRPIGRTASGIALYDLKVVRALKEQRG
jgi:DNA-binding transcriptional MerR regulator